MQNRIKTLVIAGVCTLAFATAQAEEEVSPERWNSYCKSNPERCGKAEALCESPSKEISCDKIKMAFMLKQPLPAKDN